MWCLVFVSISAVMGGELGPEFEYPETPNIEYSPLPREEEAPSPLPGMLYPRESESREVIIQIFLRCVHHRSFFHKIFIYLFFFFLQHHNLNYSNKTDKTSVYYILRKILASELNFISLDNVTDVKSID